MLFFRGEQESSALSCFGWQKLGPEDKKIETVKGVGYKFIDEGDII